jgi:adenylate cyclase
VNELFAARREAEPALAISPNLPGAYQVLAVTLIFGGRPKDGLAVLERSIRLDPNDPAMWNALSWAVIGSYFSGDYHGAITAARRAIRSSPDYPTPYRWLAAALGQLGDHSQCRGLACAIEP